MFSEAFLRLSEFGALSSYRYVGLGSTYFSDFALFHKTLGITNMVSIEREERDRDRFEFNRPYKCIRIEWGESTDVLASMAWEPRTILWLDYDGPLDTSKLSDTRLFCTSARSGSVIVVTVDARQEEIKDSADSAKPRRSKVAALRRMVGRENVPIDVKDKDLEGWELARVYRRIIDDTIRTTLSERNGLLEQGDRLIYKQLFYFHYADGAKMLSVGGIIYDKGDAPKEARCCFEELRFVRTGDKECRIEPPMLTLREVKYLDAQLPCRRRMTPKCPGVEREALKRYADVYRYYPNFAEAEL